MKIDTKVLTRKLGTFGSENCSNRKSIFVVKIVV